MSDNKDILDEILNDTAENDAEELADALETADKLDEIEEQNFNEVYNEVSEELPQNEEIPENMDNMELPPEQYYEEEQPVRQIRQAPTPQRKKKKKKKKKRRASRLPGVLILVTLIFGVSVILSLVIISFGKDMLGIGKSEETHVIVIPEDATTVEVSQMLFDDQIIKSSKAFEIFAGLGGKEVKYVTGEHFIRPNMPYETIIDELTKVPTEEMGESIQITFPEGTNLIEAANLLEYNHICDAEDFIFYFNAGGFGVDFEKRLPNDSSLKFQRMEGYLFPDTYFFYENSKPEEVCQKIYFNFDTKINGEFEVDGKTYETRLERMDELGMTLDELITMASIVQMEAANVDDMNLVASVFQNRFDDPVDFLNKLQSDPTSNYSNDVIRPNIEYYNKTIIEAYDTYLTPGLPPGAISNPGLAAIDAVLTAKESPYYYFIANTMTNETFFSETLEEHEARAAEIDLYYAEHPVEDENE